MDDRPVDDVGLGRDDCPRCGGLGYVMPDVPMTDQRFGRAVTCGCRMKDVQTSKMDQLRQMSQLGPLQHCTFESFAPEGHGLAPDQQLNLKLAYDRALAYAEEPKGWLLFKGGYGCGKTHLAAAIANVRLAEGEAVLFVNTPDLLDYLRSTYAPSSAVSYDQRFEQVRNAPLLILDDLGSHSHTEWAQEKLYQIFNYRYNLQLPTIVTTNLDLESMEPRLRSRLADNRLVAMIGIKAPDFRQSIQQAQSNLSTLSLHRDKRFDTFHLRQQELPRSQQDNLKRALQLAQTFAQDMEGWLVLNSTGYGNGKTHLAAAIANHVENQGTAVLFVVVPDLLDHLRAAFNPNSGAHLDQRFSEVKKAPLLVLDDLGTESATAWAREKLYQLFNYRYSARLPTVITSSVPVDELDPRLASRMFDPSRCTFFVLEVPSYRGQRRRR